MSRRPDLGPKPQLGYTASLIERAAHRRADASLQADPRAGAYVIGGELVIDLRQEVRIVDRVRIDPRKDARTGKPDRVQSRIDRYDT